MIVYPKKRAESEIQATLWYFLRKRKIDAHLQVTGYNPQNPKEDCRLDLVVFVDEVAKIIVECKSWSDGYSRTAIYRTNNTKQVQNYRKFFEVPVLVCARMEYITPTIKLIERILAGENITQIFVKKTGAKEPKRTPYLPDFPDFKPS